MKRAGEELLELTAVEGAEGLDVCTSKEAFAKLFLSFFWTLLSLQITTRPSDPTLTKVDWLITTISFTAPLCATISPSKTGELIRVFFFENKFLSCNPDSFPEDCGVKEEEEDALEGEELLELFWGRSWAAAMKSRSGGAPHNLMTESSEQVTSFLPLNNNQKNEQNKF